MPLNYVQLLSQLVENKQACIALVTLWGCLVLWSISVGLKAEDLRYKILQGMGHMLHVC